jgi:hypothetical protein
MSFMCAAVEDAVSCEMFANGAQSGEEAAMRERVRALRKTQNGYWASFIMVYDLEV